MSNRPKPTTKQLLPLRTVVVLMCALLVGGTAGALTYFSAEELAKAVLAGAGAFAAAVIWLDKIVAA